MTYITFLCHNQLWKVLCALMCLRTVEQAGAQFVLLLVVVICCWYVMWMHNLTHYGLSVLSYLLRCLWTMLICVWWFSLNISESQARLRMNIYCHHVNLLFFAPPEYRLPLCDLCRDCCMRPCRVVRRAWNNVFQFTHFSKPQLGLTEQWQKPKTNF